ncbi:hypothetical protein V5799_030291 [Amblyomma americanum]|uniref:Protein kinase domain-containing protein n=1 Tax=Amblyomma americanum TaxID=6943 RepID=A0AAQ4EPC9_AMBAM
MKLKGADFGLATRVHYPGQLKRSICGTTNYMAPEMLTLKGYSYEADVWSVGAHHVPATGAVSPLRVPDEGDELRENQEERIHDPLDSLLPGKRLHPVDSSTGTRKAAEHRSHHEPRVHDKGPASCTPACIVSQGRASNGCTRHRLGHNRPKTRVGEKQRLRRIRLRLPLKRFT